ncbi:MAG: hypothetical protein AB7O88_17100 [Reyranellaceae bacterium]
MARNRTISPEFWTCEAVIDCAPMTRLLLIGLWNFADDFGVQPLRPRTIRLQVFPGDAIDNDAVRAMIEELAARQLVRVYEVDGVEYLAIVDWEHSQRVGKHAKRRYPPYPSRHAGGEKAPSVSEADEGPSATEPETAVVETPASPSSALRAPSPSGPSAAPVMRGEKEQEERPPPLAAAA